MNTDNKNFQQPGSGNASNPVPDQSSTPGKSQLFDEKAEKYIRESGNIEDLPDADESKELDEPSDSKE